MLSLSPQSSKIAVRTVNANRDVYIVRNKDEFRMSPQVRERAGQKAGQKGESQ